MGFLMPFLWIFFVITLITDKKQEAQFGIILKNGAKDIITNGYNGFLIPQGDKNKFSEAIIQMISSENLRQKFGIHAIKVGKQYYREQIFPKWVKLIEQLYNTYVST
jgi:glycosyltransferase involved in cell wall biosynthesis